MRNVAILIVVLGFFLPCFGELAHVVVVDYGQDLLTFDPHTGSPTGSLLQSNDHNVQFRGIAMDAEGNLYFGVLDSVGDPYQSGGNSYVGLISIDGRTGEMLANPLVPGTVPGPGVMPRYNREIAVHSEYLYTAFNESVLYKEFPEGISRWRLSDGMTAGVHPSEPSNPQFVTSPGSSTIEEMAFGPDGKGYYIYGNKLYRFDPSVGGEPLLIVEDLIPSDRPVYGFESMGFGHDGALYFQYEWAVHRFDPDAAVSGSDIFFQAPTGYERLFGVKYNAEDGLYYATALAEGTEECHLLRFGPDGQFQDIFAESGVPGGEDIFFVPVPEPTVIGLLLGGVACLLRRRP
ncbi:MAG: PEP-CTERM sorting domain-containing protein [Phycisphaerae bacterium]